MSTNGMNCELVDQRDLDTRYVAGTLNEEDAEAFESHFFGCERCWGLVQQGLAVQAAHEGAAPTAQRPSSAPLPGSWSSTRPALRLRPWWGLAAAAALVLAVVGIRRLGPGTERTGSDDVLRGGVETLPVRASAGRTTVTAAWPRTPEVDVYRVRLYAADGTLAEEREVSDTTVTLVVSALDKLPPGAEAFWEVQALDRLRIPIARSELTRAALPDSTR